MSEVEKMMQNAGVKKLLYCDICNAQEHALGLCAETKCEPFYPPFTAEKQLSLIKWFIKQDLFDNGTQGAIDECSNFKNGLAKMVNNLWQDLTIEQREQIRGILNG